MKKLLVGTLKFVAACSGPACVVYSIDRLERYMELGMQSPDAIYTVLVHNHGLHRYITEAQDQEIRFFFVLGVLLMPVLFAIAIFDIRRKRALQSGGA